MRLIHQLKQRMRLSAVAALMAVIGLMAGASRAAAQIPQEIAADTIFTNGKVLTVDRDFSIREAIAIRDGRVLATGTTAAIQRLAGPKTQRIDLAGKTIIPGIVDIHNHFQMQALSKNKEALGAKEPRYRDFMNVAEVKGGSVDELLRNIKAVVDTRKPGTWVNIDIASRELAAPFWERIRRHDLDAVAPNNLLIVSVPQPLWGTQIINTKVVELIKDFYGAMPTEFEMDETGLLNGRIGPVLVESLIGDLLFDHPMENWYPLVKQEMQRWAELGVTTDMTRMNAQWMQPILREMERRGETPIRTAYAQLSPVFPEAGGMQARMGNVTNMGTDMLWIAGVGVTDLDYHPCATIKPSTDVYEHCMIGKPTDVKYQTLFQAVKFGNKIVSSKASGDLAVDHLMDLIEAASKAGGITPAQIVEKGHTVDHCALYPRPDQIERGKKLGLIWGCSPAFPALEVAGEFAALYGIEYANKWVVPVGSILKAGGRLAAHSGEGIRGDSLFTNIEGFMTRKDSKGQVWGPQEAIDRKDVLRMYTNGGAEYVGRPDKIGSLEVGKFADLLVLDKDYMTLPPEQFHTMHPVLTMVGGKIVFQQSAQPGATAVR